MGLVLSILLALIPIVIKCNLVQIITSCSLVGLYFLIYIIIAFVKYHKYKETKKISIKFGDSKVNIYYGDIFSVDNDGYKVIAFNEYFDTITDDHLHVIDKNSLHGIYLNKFYPNDISRDNFHKRVEDSMKEFKSHENKNRKLGYNQAYELGSLFEDNDYFTFKRYRVARRNLRIRCVATSQSNGLDMVDGVFVRRYGKRGIAYRVRKYMEISVAKFCRRIRAHLDGVDLFVFNDFLFTK